MPNSLRYWRRTGVTDEDDGIETSSGLIVGSIFYDMRRLVPAFQGTVALVLHIVKEKN